MHAAVAAESVHVFACSEVHSRWPATSLGTIEPKPLAPYLKDEMNPKRVQGSYTI